MKSLRGLIIGIVMVTVTFSLSGLAFAEMGKGACKEGMGCKGDTAAFAAHIKILKDSATALQASNPDLAKGLNDLADKKTEMMQKMQEWKNKRDAKVKLLKDSSAALKTLNPALSQELQMMCEKKDMDKEEMGEKM